MQRWIVCCVIFGAILLCFSKVNAAQKIPEYGKALTELSKRWPSGASDLLSENSKNPESYQLIRYNTAADPFYVGIRKSLLIHAPLLRVKQVFLDFSGYKILFPEFKIIRVEEQSETKAVVFWQKSIPIPLVPDVYYRLEYKIPAELTSESRAVIQYKLKFSNNLTQSDGIVFLDKINATTTRFVGFDFYNAEWGIAKTFAPDRIWGDSLAGAYRSDLAIKFKSENSSLNAESLQTKIDSHIKAFPLQVAQEPNPFENPTQ